MTITDEELRAMRARARVTFAEAWADKERAGYQYGRDALEQVRLGWDMRAQPSLLDVPRLLDEVATLSLKVENARDQHRKLFDAKNEAWARVYDLEVAQERHLRLIHDLTKAEPLPGEAEEHKQRNGVLIAEVGTLRNQVHEERARADEIFRELQQQLAHIARHEKQWADAERELDRWRHGVPIEGDYVCLGALEADRLRNETKRLTQALLDHGCPAPDVANPGGGHVCFENHVPLPTEAAFIQQIETLKAALRLARLPHRKNCSLFVDYEFGVCDCAVRGHNDAIDEALKGK